MKTKIMLKYCVIVLLVITCLFVQPVFGNSDSTIQGTAPDILPMKSSYPVTPHSIVPEIIKWGKISWSIDGVGIYPGSTGIIQVNKPAGATVKSAFMFAATTGFAHYKLAANDIMIDGTPVAWWDIADLPTSISSYNYMRDVTSIVKSKIDSAPAGRVDFTITEGNTANIDGEILVVIFDDPTQTTENTVVLLFGAQNVAGDDFNIGLGKPLDLSDPNLGLDLSLGISYSNEDYFTIEHPPQFNIVDVNGLRMTTFAGGDDDGTGPMHNGELLTVGGLDDSTANPADPYAVPIGNERYDDELYTLLPFVKTGDIQIHVHTLDPSMDENIFFAGLFIHSTAAVVGKGILLIPASATNPLDTQHTVTAKVQDVTGAPIIGEVITFTITDGPNSGVTGTGTTDINGEATFSYIGNIAGTDTILASFLDTTGIDPTTITSNEATKKWEGEGPIPTPEFPSTILPVAMIIGFLGAVLLIQRTREQ